MAGLLIINADDLGAEPETTDAILECFTARRITSASEMVYMKDSRRAARLADGLPLGLHLNLTQPFEDADTPGPIRDRQARLVRHFASPRLRRFTYDPRVAGAIESAISDQLGAFEALCGRPPTHFDGHHDVQLSLNVLFARTLPWGSRLRGPHTWQGRRLSPGGIPRAFRHWLISKLYVSTDYVFELKTDPIRLGDGGPGQGLALADTETVEVVVHPNRRGQQSFLMSDEWGSLVGACRLGSFEDLAR